MSVLVKGMKMPSACFWRDKNGSLTICPLCDADGYCGANGKQRCLVPENEMPSDCPLIELPPHGRLIDADALAKSIKDQIELIKLFRNEELDRVAQMIEVGYMQEIANAPTILEAEVEE